MDRRATVSHFELPAADLERAATFYREAFGWHLEPRPWAGGDYLAVRTERRAGEAAIDGGLLPGSPEVPRPLLVLHVHGASLEEWLEAIERHGGSAVAPPREVGRWGRFATFRDPEGNLLGLWEAAGD